MRKPAGYWKSEQNVINALTPYINELGFIPSQREIKKLDSSLASAIKAYYPMEQVYSWFGKEDEYEYKNHKPDGHWKKEQNVIDALTPYVTELGYIPSLPEIKKLDSCLARAINRYYPMYQIYSWFGKEDDYKCKNHKPAGYWKNKDNIMTLFEEIINKEDEIPSATKLIDLGYQDLVSALSRHKYKLTEIRKLFGQEEKNPKDRSKYNDIELIYKEINEYVDEFKEIPTVDDLERIGKSHLVKAIHRRHQSNYTKVLKQMGLQVNKNENAYWQNTDNIVKNAKLIIKAFGHLPSQRTLAKDSRFQSFCVAVSKIYGGFHKLRDDLGLEQLKKEQGYWKDEQGLLDELVDVINMYDGYIPTYLHKKGLAHLACAMQNYGGIYTFAKKHNLPLQNTKIPYTYYDDVEKLNEKVDELIKTFNNFPSSTELLHHGEFAVMRRLCNKYGSIANAAIEYGFERNVIKSLDGHLCDSFSERIVDDYLFGCNVPHKRNLKLHLGKINVVPDFILSDKVVIEVLMCDYRLPTDYHISKVYIARYSEKRDAYLENGYKLIEIFPEDLTSSVKLDLKLYDLVKGFANSPFKDLSKLPLSKKNKRPNGYWKEFNNMKKELLPLCEDLGRMPTYSELKSLGLGKVSTIAKMYHGSLHEVAERLGYPY